MTAGFRTLDSSDIEELPYNNALYNARGETCLPAGRFELFPIYNARGGSRTLKAFAIRF